MAACCPLLPSGINDEGLLRVRFGPFAKPSVYDRYLRIPSVQGTNREGQLRVKGGRRSAARGKSQKGGNAG